MRKGQNKWGREVGREEPGTSLLLFGSGIWFLPYVGRRSAAFPAKDDEWLRFKIGSLGASLLFGAL